MKRIKEAIALYRILSASQPAIAGCTLGVAALRGLTWTVQAEK